GTPNNLYRSFSHEKDHIIIIFLFEATILITGKTTFCFETSHSDVSGLGVAGTEEA
ncbi:unnamed protein product, partial [Dovyalis caffra]